MSNLKSHRRAAGLTQAQLAKQAGVSRQLVGAVEAGRHLPRVDAGIALAAALGVDVAQLFAVAPAPRDVLTGAAPAAGTLVRAARVGDSAVTAPMLSGTGGWSVADAIVEANSLNQLEAHAPGLVVAGCEPGLEILERMLREAGMGALSVMASSAVAIDALAAGRVHAAVVHGPALARYAEAGSTVRFRLGAWQVGLAASPDSDPQWFGEAEAGRIAVVQREQGAGVQRTFEERAGDSVPGPIVTGHVAAAERAMITGMPAVTIEPAACALGASFEALDVHDVEIWVAEAWARERFVAAALDMIQSPRFQLRLRAVGGYDLSGSGSRVA